LSVAFQQWKNVPSYKNQQVLVAIMMCRISQKEESGKKEEYVWSKILILVLNFWVPNHKASSYLKLTEILFWRYLWVTRWSLFLI
jgi:hypothetical protein